MYFFLFRIDGKLNHITMICSTKTETWLEIRSNLQSKHVDDHENGRRCLHGRRKRVWDPVLWVLFIQYCSGCTEPSICACNLMEYWDEWRMLLQFLIIVDMTDAHMALSGRSVMIKSLNSCIGFLTLCSKLELELSCACMQAGPERKNFLVISQNFLWEVEFLKSGTWLRLILPY